MSILCYILGIVMLVCGLYGVSAAPEGLGAYLLLSGIFCAFLFVFMGGLYNNLQDMKKTLGTISNDPLNPFANRYYRQVLAKALRDKLGSESMPYSAAGQNGITDEYLLPTAGGPYRAKAYFYFKEADGTQKLYAVSGSIRCADTARFWSLDAWEVSGELKIE